MLTATVRSKIPERFQATKRLLAAKPGRRMMGRSGGATIRRVYDEPADSDGLRVLVDRVWPRGLSKTRAAVGLWLRDIAPTDELRRWFGHDPERWGAFRERYWAELDDHGEAVGRLRNMIGEGPVTLLYGARDDAHNNAVALLDYLMREDGD